MSNGDVNNDVSPFSLSRHCRPPLHFFAQQDNRPVKILCLPICAPLIDPFITEKNEDIPSSSEGELNFIKQIKYAPMPISPKPNARTTPRPPAAKPLPPGGKTNDFMTVGGRQNNLQMIDFFLFYIKRWHAV